MRFRWEEEQHHGGGSNALFFVMSLFGGLKVLTFGSTKKYYKLLMPAALQTRNARLLKAERTFSKSSQSSI